MNKEEILEMARKADIWVAGQLPYQKQLETFAITVTERERNACAYLCEVLANNCTNKSVAVGMRLCADEIRARGQE
jgi:uncharacterized membrane protein